MVDPPRTVPRVPKALVGGLAALIAVDVVVMFLGAVKIGVTLDEPVHVARLQNFLRFGWYLPRWDLVGGRVADDALGLYVYAPIAAIVGHVVGVVAGAETWGTVSGSADAYVARHVAVALFASLALLAVAASARLLFGSWRWGVVAAAVLASIPVFTGHGMFNVKDVPVACGFSIATFAAIALTRPGIARPRTLIVAGGALALGTLIAVGVRPAMLPALGLTVVVALLLGGLTRSRLVPVIAGFAAGYLPLMVIYPRVFTDPRGMLLAVLDSADYPWVGTTLTAGMDLPDHPPWFYLPLWLGAQTPVVISALALVAFGWWVRTLPRLRGCSDDERTLWAGTAVVLSQAVALPTFAVLSGATLYGAARQVLFVLPAVALLATVGFWLLLERAEIRAPRRAWAKPVLVGMLVAGLAVPSLSSAALFPYGYTWFNAVTALRPIDGNWRTDYWWASVNESVTRVDALDDARCQVQQKPCLTRKTLIPFQDSLGTNRVGPGLRPGEYWRITFAPAVQGAPRTCDPVDAITRQLFWRTVTMSWIERCRR